MPVSARLTLWRPWSGFRNEHRACIRRGIAGKVRRAEFSEWSTCYFLECLRLFARTRFLWTLLTDLSPSDATFVAAA